MFENGKITKTKLPKKGSYALCSECGLVGYGKVKIKCLEFKSSNYLKKEN
jgi:hypothetical protein